MNKEEKLLTARRRLREFQQQKNNPQNNGKKDHQKITQKLKQIQQIKNNSQDVSTGQNELEQNSSPAKVLPEQIDQPPKAEIPGTPSPPSRQNFEASEITDNPVNSNLINFEDSTTNSTSNFEARAEETETKVPIVEIPESQIMENSGVKSPEIGTNIHQENEYRPSVEQFENHVSSGAQAFFVPEENSTNESPSQKDHLLQMATAVADALIDNSESSTFPSGNELEYKNQFLSSCLEEQKQLANNLRVQVSQYSSRIAELEAIVATKDAEFEAKLLREVNPLKEQLMVHAQTTGILVAEKAELTSARDECHSIAQRKSERVEELTGQLKNSQTCVSQLEKELAQHRMIVDETRKLYQQLHLDYAEMDKRCVELRKSKEDCDLEIAELRQELSMKNAENANLRREIEEKTALLGLSELKIQQLTSTPQEIQDLEDQHQTTKVLELQLSQSRDSLKSVIREKEEAAKQYENYVRQLDTRYENLTKELDEARKKLQTHEETEKSLRQNMAQLEEKFKVEKDQVQKLLPLEANEERIEHLTKSLEALTLENSQYQTILIERDAEIETLKRDLEKQQDMNEDNVEKSKLVTALESEQLGASRAVAQNQQLKMELNEMHDAFVSLSNSKLDLTEQLQAERTIGKKLNAQLNETETQLDGLQEQLRLKALELEEMEREKLRNAQIADQIHHYQAQSNQARTLEQELQNSLGCIEILRRENELLTERINRDREMNEKLANGLDENDETSGRIAKSLANGTYVPDSLKKLEIRFKETMEKLAEVTDENQRLEHLVLQLQGETETIGEYVTLYQKQRAILQRKAQEREQSFRQLVEQRNHQQQQLHKLKVLVADLIRKKCTGANDDPSTEAMLDDKDTNARTAEISPENPSEDIVVDDKDKTTSKILDLLTEIKDCKDSCITEPNFHPCPWCSGKLITV